jgi:hypothetical protein
MRGYIACGGGKRDLNGTLYSTRTHEEVTCANCRRTTRYRGEVAFLTVARQIGGFPFSTLAETEVAVRRGGVDPKRARRFIDAFNAYQNAGASNVR